MNKINYNVTDVPGVLVGHASNKSARTGCTVILLPRGSTGGVDVRGGAPGTRETDLLRPMHLVPEIHAILLAGGSAFGLDAASGVMEFLEQKDIGFNTGEALVPIVPSAVIYDLAIGNSKTRPDKKMGIEACQSAKSGLISEGAIGAGTGATVGKALGMDYCSFGGIGNWAVHTSDGLIVAALVVVNAFGEVIGEDGSIIAGVRQPKGNFLPTLNIMAEKDAQFNPMTNTTIGAIVTNAALTREEVNKVAQMAHNGLAKSIRPVHTLYDGDTIFSVATGKIKADVNLIGALSAEVLATAVRRGVQESANEKGN
ncbi:P1 family peptidase [Bacillota bacterium LX-D]|nr:P1 family peptidase [Bacillota bacterium LX-D]